MKNTSRAENWANIKKCNKCDSNEGEFIMTLNNISVYGTYAIDMIIDNDKIDFCSENLSVTQKLNCTNE